MSGHHNRLMVMPANNTHSLVHYWQGRLFEVAC